ncbi:MAG: hypothetical protein JO353_09605 [Phycisphaerae bacterium]|nr:hypothetical protein [Phycisphaerae bacterium]
MPISQKNKIYFGIVACGVAALVTDRLTRPADPNTTAASSVSPSQLLVTSADRPSTAPATMPLSEDCRSVAELLRSVAHRSSWRRTTAPSNPNPFANAVVPTRAVSNSGVAFTRAHRLTAVVNAGGTSHAMVDGQICSVGQSIDGFTLRSISATRAIFQKGADCVSLELQGQMPSPMAK